MWSYTLSSNWENYEPFFPARYHKLLTLGTSESYFSRFAFGHVWYRPGARQLSGATWEGCCRAFQEAVSIGWALLPVATRRRGPLRIRSAHPGQRDSDCIDLMVMAFNTWQMVKKTVTLWTLSMREASI
eukprot:s1631_g10.t1